MDEPRITFCRLIPQARLPQRADRAAAGSLPTRAFRYCEPVVVASSFGYYVFPPMGFSLLWDGDEVLWTFDGMPGWAKLTAAQFPGFADHFDAHAPAAIQGFSPPFLGALQEPGLVQLWTGLVVRTAPGWAVLVRPCANMARHGAYELFEGVIETDRWFGPLITNMRVTKTDLPIVFRPDFPLLQVQLVSRESLDDRAQDDFGIVSDLGALRARDWDDFHAAVVRPNVRPDRLPGAYAAASRRRRKGATAAS